MIVDTDKTYSWRNFHFTPRPKPIEGIFSAGGFVAYVIGRALKLKKGATPLAASGGKELSVRSVLRIARLANRARGWGAGRTIWDMTRAFGVSLTGVSQKMLDQTEHTPIVIVRPSFDYDLAYSISSQNQNSEVDYLAVLRIYEAGDIDA
jgi:F420-0:gamma-glutamyl ligase-like protein